MLIWQSDCVPSILLLRVGVGSLLLCGGRELINLPNQGHFNPQVTQTTRTLPPDRFKELCLQADH